MNLNALSSSTAQPLLTGSELAGIKVVLPPSEVQSNTATAWMGRTAEVRKLIEVLGKSVDMLTEMKRSLITAAVTGEFDVCTADGSQVPV